MLPKFKFQLTLFFYALSYFTRIPIPASIVFDNEQFYKANAYFPLVGALVAAFMFAIFYVLQIFFSLPVSIIFMLIGSLLLTGALHEDGFADCCDGFGGGYDATQRLKIMKDSQIGTYAGVGLIMLFLLKFTLLVELTNIGYQALLIGLLTAHVLSRYCSLWLLHGLNYVRLGDTGKSQALAPKLSPGYFCFASLCALASLLLLSLPIALLIVVVISIVTRLLRNEFVKNIGGYTGDCLGLTQQCVEIAVLLLLTAVL